MKYKWTHNVKINSIYKESLTCLNEKNAQRYIDSILMVPFFSILRKGSRVVSLVERRSDESNNWMYVYEN
jgi:hypothetical protein